MTMELQGQLRLNTNNQVQQTSSRIPLSEQQEYFIYMNKKNKNVELMFQKGYRPQGTEFLDAYNKNVLRDGTSSTILTGISYRNMHYVVVEYE